MLEQYGVEWRGTRPIARLREVHRVMRTFLDEGSIDSEGDFYSYSGQIESWKAWAGIDVEGLPDLEDQVRLVGEQVIPKLAAL